MQIPQFHRKIVNLVFNKYLENYLFSVNYYKNLDDQSYRFNRGISIDQRHDIALKEYQDEQYNVTTYKEILKNENIEGSVLNEFIFLQSIKLAIREEMQRAIDYDKNKYIVQMAYKNAVYLLDLLNLNTDKYKHVTAKYFLYYN